MVFLCRAHEADFTEGGWSWAQLPAAKKRQQEVGSWVVAPRGQSFAKAEQQQVAIPCNQPKSQAFPTAKPGGAKFFFRTRRRQSEVFQEPELRAPDPAIPGSAKAARGCSSGRLRAAKRLKIHEQEAEAVKGIGDDGAFHLRVVSRSVVLPRSWLQPHTTRLGTRRARR